jgi:hypothetical protein
MDEMRKYRVSFTKMVQAVDEDMAQLFAADALKTGAADNVEVVLIASSVEDRLEHSRPPVGTWQRHDARAVSR